MKVYFSFKDWDFVMEVQERPSKGDAVEVEESKVVKNLKKASIIVGRKILVKDKMDNKSYGGRSIPVFRVCLMPC